MDLDKWITNVKEDQHLSEDKYQTVDSGHVSNASIPWNTQGGNHDLRENGFFSNSVNNHDQQAEPTSGTIQDGASINSVSTSGATGMSQGSSGYDAYPNTDPYGYSSAGYASYYNQYQQQPNQYQQQPNQYQQQPNQYQQQPNQYQQPSNQYQPPSNQYQTPSNQYQPPANQYQPPSNQYQPPANHYQPPSNHYQPPSNQYQPPSNQYQPPPNQYQEPSHQYQQPSAESVPHHVGAYQNTGAPYQPLSSFQNTGSFAGPASYTSTYLDPGAYQTSGSYTSSTYGTQTNSWHGGQHAAYSSHQYSHYPPPPDSNSSYSSTYVAGSSQYEQHYNKQWEDYYNQSEVSCAPGTENISVPGASSVACSVPSGSSGHTVSNNQIPAAYTSSQVPVFSSSELTSMQPVTVSGSISDTYWKQGSSVFQSELPNTVQPHTPKPPDEVSLYGSFQNQQNSTFTHMALYPASYQVSQRHQSSIQTVSQPTEHQDSRKASKLQIPTNPRINPSLPFSQPKTARDTSVTSTAVKPAYISVSLQTSNAKVVSHDEGDSMFKPGTFPKSLRGYVERALGRCKDDRQKEACQDIMKEVIKKATGDGTLFTRDWDTEPLFPLPNIGAVNKDDVEFPKSTSTIPKNRSPGRRAKSRWEPVPDEKEKSANNSNGTAKYNRLNKQFLVGKLDDSFGTKFSSPDQRSFNKNVSRPAKRQRLGSDLNETDDGEASSDSDKEHSLTKYYSAATTLIDSPEEKRRRENRSKRFDKGHGNRAKNNNLREKDVDAGNSYARRASASLLSRTFESGSRAVEDIDWDALIVKGTCQEIEKRYLRLTSAPDPASVRPEEVLEKALVLVQNSQKNYLYKCDQLKSIRQDLTVQHIRNELTVKVYETHARLAIEAGDLPEYNQCQSQLTTLYAEGIWGCHMEFAAYNLLCVILHSNNNRDLLSAMSRLSVDSKKDEAVMHALSVRAAVTSGNYVTFFRLYKTAPNLNTFLMDLYVEKMRYTALKCISRSHRPTIPVSYLSQILGFASGLPTREPSDEKEIDGAEECKDWLKAHGACFTSDNSGEILLDAKASVSSLYMPEPDDAVAHGDVNLAVNDFFTRSLV